MKLVKTMMAAAAAAACVSVSAAGLPNIAVLATGGTIEIGRASCRERV